MNGRVLLFILVILFLTGCAGDGGGEDALDTSNDISSDSNDVSTSGSDTQIPCPIGAEGCACTTGGACDAGLTCFSELCVDAAGDTESLPVIDSDSHDGTLGTTAADPVSTDSVDTNTADTQSSDTGTIPVDTADTGDTAADTGDVDTQDSAPVDTDTVDTQVSDTHTEDTNPVNNSDSSIGDTTPADSESTDTETVDTNTGDTATSSATEDTNTVADCATIEDIRHATVGMVDFDMCAAVVTQVSANGFYVQAGNTGPGIYFYEGPSWTPDVAVGDEIAVTVLEVTDYFDLREVVDHGAIEILSNIGDISGLVQTLPSGTMIEEQYESELLLLNEVAVTAHEENLTTVDFGGVSVAIRGISSSLCIGETFDVQAVAVQSGSNFLLDIFDDNTQLTNRDTSGCLDLGRVPVVGDLVLNEFLAAPDSATGDANCDGFAESTNDEFVELVNISSDSLDMSGVTIADATGIRATLPLGTSLLPGQPLVVFGGGTPSCAAFTAGNVVTHTDMLGLTNSGDTIVVAAADTTPLIEVTYGAEAGDNQSLTLDPDLSGTVYVTHSTATGSGGTPYSPGTHADGTAFLP